jgi:hypothetical protein
MTIQKEDIKYLLPIRYAAHCYWNKSNYWELNNWRNYILSWNNPCSYWDFFWSFVFNKSGKFRTRTLKYLKDENALTPMGFIMFYHRCLEFYVLSGIEQNKSAIK